MRFLRTASTRRLLAVITAVVVVIAGGAAIAVAATSGGPVPAATSLAQAVHRSLSAPTVPGISADIRFTNNLIDSSDFTGQGTDPLLQGASGRLWVSDDGQLRLELQSDNGDAQVVVDHDSFWISDPTENTVYEGTLPAERTGAGDHGRHAVPSIAQIQSEITRLMGSVDLSGAQPTDVAGQAAYRVVVSPKQSGGLLGSVGLAWDAIRGVPLELAIYARGDSTPVLALQATHISYGAVASGDFDVTPPAGARVVKIVRPAPGAGSRHAGSRTAVTGLGAVAAQLPFTLDAPATLAGLSRQSVRLLDVDGARAALVSYGSDLSGVAVIESGARGETRSPSRIGLGGGLSLPTVSIGSVTGTELSTALGTVITFTRDGVRDTVIGSVTATAAERVARAL